MEELKERKDSWPQRSRSQRPKNQKPEFKSNRGTSYKTKVKGFSKTKVSKPRRGGDAMEGPLITEKNLSN